MFLNKATSFPTGNSQHVVGEVHRDLPPGRLQERHQPGQLHQDDGLELCLHRLLIRVSPEPSSATPGSGSSSAGLGAGVGPFPGSPAISTASHSLGIYSAFIAATTITSCATKVYIFMKLD